ncbi:MAG: hypothetical protein LBV04_02305 [Deferribacteraceae bacterium]|jgi:hypothetical protein|nr:hypothetical protein [Deferribacteraceae bacterium]
MELLQEISRGFKAFPTFPHTIKAKSIELVISFGDLEDGVEAFALLEGYLEELQNAGFRKGTSFRKIDLEFKFNYEADDFEEDDSWLVGLEFTFIKSIDQTIDSIDELVKIVLQEFPPINMFELEYCAIDAIDLHVQYDDTPLEQTVLLEYENKLTAQKFEYDEEYVMYDKLIDSRESIVNSDTGWCQLHYQSYQQSIISWFLEG